ncbi:MAG TPA: methyltransferase domain-containing protein [Mycobacteriales bacterium]|nr:methyltransferase domain-containing protein [Mycobacteriales bacterium]
MTVPEWISRARDLAARLARAGVVPSPRWRAAFEQIPRHVFVPRFYEDDEHGHPTMVDGADPAERQRWLDAIYSDRMLVVQVLPIPDALDPTGAPATMWSSSSSMPSLMALMLEALDIQDGHRVLEIGTGTGYNAALLCHRLGESGVTSIDICPELVHEANGHLAELGYHPTLAVGDGLAGMPDAGPFDRIISTSATSTIPPCWIEQLRPGGKIITDLRGDITGGLILLTKIGADVVSGPYLSSRAHFMWLRPYAKDPLRPGDPLHGSDLDLRTTGHETTGLDPATLVHDPDLRFFAQLMLPDAVLLHPLPLPAGTVTSLRRGSGSFALVHHAARPDGTFAVDYSGPDNPWQTVEYTYKQWLTLGRPAPDRFGLTASTAGQSYYWLDDPDTGPTWPAAHQA